jgi:hypothetical protein
VGYSAVALALGYVAITLASTVAGAVPDAVEARLAYLAERRDRRQMMLDHELDDAVREAMTAR